MAPKIVTGPDFPRIGLVGNGGDQSYGSNSGTGYPLWTTATSGPAYTATQQIGAFDIAILGSTYEGSVGKTLTLSWDNNASRDRENLTQTLLKNGVTNKINNSRPTLTFYYANMNEGLLPASSPYSTWMTLVANNNWWLYESAGGTGVVTPSAFGGGNQLINYACAWPNAIGSAGKDASIAGVNYGTLSNGQGPARTSARYQVSKLLTRNILDTRFQNLWHPQMASPSAAGVFMDNCFVGLNGGGSVANSYLDGINVTAGNTNTPSPLLVRGQQHFWDEYVKYLTQTNQSGSYYNFGNITGYGDIYEHGNIAAATSNALVGYMHGGLLETVMGAGGSSWEWWQTGGTDPTGWNNVRLNYYAGMDFCVAPKMCMLGIRVPATDGSSTASFGVSGALTTVSAGTALEYQLMRYGLCTTLLDDGYLGLGISGYNYALTRWYDEFGDDSLTQVNVKRGYLGQPVSSRPTVKTWTGGFFGIWSRQFTNGIAIVNPRGNGPQTVTQAMLGAATGNSTWHFLQGTQQPAINTGALFASRTLADGDGLVLLKG